MWLVTSLCILNLVVSILTLSRITMLINTQIPLMYKRRNKQDNYMQACLEKLEKLEKNLYRIVEIISKEEQADA